MECSNAFVKYVSFFPNFPQVVVILSKVHARIFRFVTIEFQLEISFWIIIMEVWLFVFVQPSQSPDDVDRSVDRIFFVSGIGCIRKLFFKNIQMAFFMTLNFVFFSLTGNKRASVRYDIYSIISYSRVQLVAIQSTHELVLANAFVLSKSFATLKIQFFKFNPDTKILCTVMKKYNFKLSGRICDLVKMTFGRSTHRSLGGDIVIRSVTTYAIHISNCDISTFHLTLFVGSGQAECHVFVLGCGIQKMKYSFWLFLYLLKIDFYFVI